MVMSIPDPAGCGKTIVACQTLDVLSVLDKETITRRMLKKAKLLTRPTLAVISPTRPASAKTDSSPWDAPYPKQGRSELSLHKGWVG